MVRTQDLVDTIDDAFERLAAEELSSATTFITGPSRSGDLEMVTTYGVHGPLNLIYVLVHS